MKTRIFKYIAVVALLFMAIPMQGQNYLKLWFKDGHTERHFMHLVKSISATKYDLEGNLHSDYQMQQIIMEDTTYSYYIADIDSMSFKKVDEEQIAKDVQNVTIFTENLFQQYQDSTTIAKHLDEIVSQDGVEAVSLTNSDLSIRIRDWGLFLYHFPHDKNTVINAKNNKLFKSRIKTNNNIGKFKSPNRAVNVALINQASKDEGRAYVQEELDELENYFYEMGFIPKIIKGDEVTVDFFKEDIFNYDLILLVTHGSYSDEVGLGRKQHWLYTGEEVTIRLDKEEGLQWYNKVKELKDGIVDFEEVVYGYLGEERSEYGTENDSVWVYYKMVSEDIFSSEKGYKFNDYHNTIFFNGACQSLKGSGTLLREYNGVEAESLSGDASMANSLINKNLDVYLGYNQSNSVGPEAGSLFYKYMLYGNSEEAALYYMKKYNSWAMDNSKDGYTAYLIDIRANEKARSMFLVKTFTDELSSKEVEAEFLANSKVTIRGYTSMLDIDASIVKCGFRYGDDSKLNNYIESEIKKEQYERVSNSLGNVSFSFVLEPAPRQTMYYQAYTYDGIHYNLGEIYSFTTPEASTPYHDLCPDGNHPHMIDLGLPSGTKWSCCNVGASVPTAYGNYYAWGETSTKSTYTKENYKYHHTDSDGKYVYDDATFTMAPTPDQVKELFANCTATETSVDGVAGEKLTSKKNGKKIFLPYGGAKGTSTVGVGEEYQYWTSQLEKSASNSKLLAPRQYSDNETDDLGNPYAFDWYEKDFRYIGKTVRKASK